MRKTGSVLKDAAEEITEYYDKNTKKFLRYGHGGEDLAIHRAVWGTGAEDRKSAMHYIDDGIGLIAKNIEAGKIVDLGCGCGGSLIYLETAYPSAGYYGITISGVQKECADRAVRSRGLRTSIHTGSYLDRDFYRSAGLPRRPHEAPVLFFAIESFIHCRAPEQFFETVREFTLPGDMLIICDDFTAQPPKNRRQERLFREFASGWRAGNVLDTERFKELTCRFHFKLNEQQDLTPMLELNRPRDRLIRLSIPLVRLFGPKRPFAGNLLGGNALQRLLLEGVVKYNCFILERTGPNHP
jgi:hypothetical protein